jgi:hypothetical protein
MQNAETVLGVLRDRGRKGLPCEQLYRQMFNMQLYLLFGLRADLLQPGSYEPGGHGRDRGRHDPREDRRHHRGDAL